MQQFHSISLIYHWEASNSVPLKDFLKTLLHIPLGTQWIVASSIEFRDFHESLCDETLVLFNEFLLGTNNSFSYVKADSWQEQRSGAFSRANREYVLLFSSLLTLDLSFFTDLSIHIGEIYQSKNKVFLYNIGFLPSLFSKKKLARQMFLQKNLNFLIARSSLELAYNFLQSPMIKSSEFLDITINHKKLKNIELQSWSLSDLINKGKSKAWEISYSDIELEKTSKKTGEACAVVVFVKTPGFSPLKTRLAKGTGKLRAENFHLLSVRRIEEVLKEAKKKLGVQIFWSVAEKEALSSDLWSAFPRLLQVDGELGDKLNAVYQQLQNDFNEVIFLGADCPQISLGDIREAIHSVSLSDYHIGLSEDGGYYLFCGKSPISEDLWTSVPYSVANTAEVFCEKLQKTGSLSRSSNIYQDVDTVEEYRVVTNLMYSDE